MPDPHSSLQLISSRPQGGQVRYSVYQCGCAALKTDPAPHGRTCKKSRGCSEIDFSSLAGNGFRHGATMIVAKIAGDAMNPKILPFSFVIATLERAQLD